MVNNSKAVDLSSNQKKKVKLMSKVAYVLTIVFIAVSLFAWYGGLIEGSIATSKQLFVIMSVFGLCIVVLHCGIFLNYRRLWGVRFVAIVVVIAIAIMLQVVAGLSFKDKFIL